MAPVPPEKWNDIREELEYCPTSGNPDPFT